MLRVTVGRRAQKLLTYNPYLLCRYLATTGNSTNASATARKAKTRSAVGTGPPRPAFDKILVANRGEIACRIIRTANRMGIKTVAVYSDIDDGALHTRLADEAVHIGKSSSLESYLNIDRVMGAVLATGAQAVHPGYGFLSENTHFAAACEKAGVAFIGPPSSAIESMGDKLRSKHIARDAGVTTIPGFMGTIDTVADAKRIASDIGYPVMIKASGGGGGKGMRIAWNDEEVASGFQRSKEEAMKAFNDDRMLVEKYIDSGHHIEIQVLADSHGNVLAFPERECSVQRRNQKVIEESPSCLLTQKTRAAMQDQAIALCRAVGYRSAGTVEFICASDQSFYFLEMNTRLQVEHPVTEFVSGADLVEEMINVAANKSLSAGLLKHGPHIPFKGHAIEARVYAEDPFRSFLPSSGPLVTYCEPQYNYEAGELDVIALKETESPPQSLRMGSGPIRVDAGVQEGSNISQFYDPMISKLITFGASRAEALSIMGKALDAYVIKGIGHNIAFLRDVTRHPAFIEGKYSTTFIPKYYPKGFSGVKLTLKETRHLAACAAFIHKIRLSRDATVGNIPLARENTGVHAYAPYTHTVHHHHHHHRHIQQETGLGLGATLPKKNDKLAVVIGGPKGDVHWVTFLDDLEDDGPAAIVEVEGSEEGDGSRVKIGNMEWELESVLLKGTLDGEKRAMQYLGSKGEGYNIAFLGSYQHAIVRSPLEQDLSKHLLPPVVIDGSMMLRCPMPGAVISIAVTEGQVVEEGQELAVVEAMKMQNVLRAPKKTKIAAIKCKPGDALKVDAIMMNFASAEV